MKRIWILAGEASGDLYGARLAEELRRIAAERGEPLELSGMGGPRMIAAGIPVKVDSSELGVMGLIEVLKLLFTFIGVFFKLVFAARRERPDATVLIDYPGFNLLFALVMKLSGIRVVWYISPHLWVWGKWRKPVLARLCSRMLVIFPFETEVFAGTGLRCDFVGHPLIDIVEERRDPAIRRDPDVFLLLPGSRKMEIARLFRPMLDCLAPLAAERPGLVFHLAAPREKIAAQCRAILDAYRRKHPETPEVTISVGDTGEWLQRAGTGLAASGTITVEAAIAGLPLVVGYRLNYVTLAIASLVVRLYRGFFTMTNIIADRAVYREFLQWHFVPKELLPAIREILPDGARRAEVESGMDEVRELLSDRGATATAARRAALACWEEASIPPKNAKGIDKTAKA